MAVQLSLLALYGISGVIIGAAIVFSIAIRMFGITYNSTLPVTAIPVNKDNQLLLNNNEINEDGRQNTIIAMLNVNSQKDMNNEIP